MVDINDIWEAREMGADASWAGKVGDPWADMAFVGFVQSETKADQEALAQAWITGWKDWEEE